MTISPDPCSILSRQIDEPPLGTIKTHAAVYLLLEYRAEWRAKATSDNDLPDSVQSRLDSLLADHDPARLLFIRQPQRTGPLAFYVIVATEENPRLHRFELKTYEDLLTLDIDSVIAGTSPFRTSDEKLFTVCTNGKRDACCAQLGTSTYASLTEVAGDAVWQSTHIGGHRFAATGYCFPHALCYARIDLHEPADYINTYRNGLVTGGYRGRGLYPRIGQVAEGYLREHTGIRDVEAFKLVSIKEGDPLSTLVFDIPTRGKRIEVQLTGMPVGEVQASCGKSDTEPLMKWAVVFDESDLL